MPHVRNTLNRAIPYSRGLLAFSIISPFRVAHQRPWFTNPKIDWHSRTDVKKARARFCGNLRGKSIREVAVISPSPPANPMDVLKSSFYNSRNNVRSRRKLFSLATLFLRRSLFGISNLRQLWNSTIEFQPRTPSKYFANSAGTERRYYSRRSANSELSSITADGVFELPALSRISK